jgi:hypothetical protein
MTNIENNYAQTLKRPNGTFTLSLITNDYIFYCNLEDNNINKNVEMYERIGKNRKKLISGDYFASESLYFSLKTNRSIYITPTLKEIYEKESV